MALVAGIDSSTQSCKVVVRDADTGALVRSGRASHPDGTEVAPWYWWDALQSAIVSAGGLDDVDAVSVGGQQHGMVALDARGEVVRDALLWNDTRSAPAALDLIEELGGPQAWADAVGSVPVASLTVTKLRWLRDAEPENAARVAAVALPHDWLTWRLAGAPGLDALVTDRSDASGTGYWSPATEDYRHDLLELALGHDALVPRVLGPSEAGPRTTGGAILGPGAGDNAAAALALGLQPGDVAVSIGTSGVVSAIASARRRPTAPAWSPGSPTPPAASCPLACTLNASRVLDAAARMLGVDHAGLSALALSAPAGADGLVLVPYLEGERTPNKPDATGALHGLRLAQHDPRAPGPRRGRGHAVRARRRDRRAAGPGRRRSSGCSSSAAARSPPRCGRSRRRCSGSTSASRRPASTWPTGPPGRPRGCSPGRRRRRPGARPPRRRCSPAPRSRRSASSTPRCAS